MTPAQQLIGELSDPLNNPDVLARKKAEEEEEELMKRIFHLVPRKQRSLRKPIKDNFPDFSQVPRRKRTAYTYTICKSPPKDPPPKSPEVVGTSPSRPKPLNTQEWLLQVMTKMKIVDDPIHIIDKALDLNDVDERQNHLLMPVESLIRNDFLTPEETRITEEDYENDGNMGVAAFLLDQRSKQWNVVLRKWFLKSDSGRYYWSYMLRGEWSDVVEANGLKDGDNISLWSFRYHGVICFALAPPPSPAVVS